MSRVVCVNVQLLWEARGALDSTYDAVFDHLLSLPPTKVDVEVRWMMIDGDDETDDGYPCPTPCSGVRLLIVLPLPHPPHPTQTQHGHLPHHRDTGHNTDTARIGLTHIRTPNINTHTHSTHLPCALDISLAHPPFLALMV